MVQYTQLLLGLCAIATAIDIKAWQYYGCGGGMATWYNVEPDHCADSSSLFLQGGSIHSVKTVAVPSWWTITTLTYTDGGCKTIQAREASTGDSKCIDYWNERVITGVGYYFRNKRSVGNEEPRNCTASVPPNRVTWADGTSFNITGLDSASAGTIFAATKLSDLPQGLQALAE